MKRTGYSVFLFVLLVISFGLSGRVYAQEPLTALNGTTGYTYYKAQFGYHTDDETGMQLLTYRYYDPSRGRFLTRDPISYEGGMNVYAYVTNNPITYADPFGLQRGSDWFDSWNRWADIRASQRFWDCIHQESIQKGGWIAATGADVMNGFISLGQLPDIQEDGEILGFEASTTQKITAGADLARIAATWYFGITGAEIVSKQSEESSNRSVGKPSLAPRMGTDPC